MGILTGDSLEARSLVSVENQYVFPMNVPETGPPPRSFPWAVPDYPDESEKDRYQYIIIYIYSHWLYSWARTPITLKLDAKFRSRTTGTKPTPKLSERWQYFIRDDET